MQGGAVVRDVIERRIMPRMQVRVEAVAREQRGVIAAFNDPAILQHDDLVRVANGGEPVGDHQAGAPREQHFQRALDFAAR